MVLNRPDIFFGVAFNADPFDPAAVPTWSDLTARVRSIGSAGRGRQYELDRNQNGTMDVTWYNADEALNPANTGSPYYPNVQPYRQILARAMYPNGGTGNLLNLLYNGTDPTFDSYPDSTAAPLWLLRIGVTFPSLTAGLPFQGTECVIYAVAAGAVVQGTAWAVPCIPGRQYTSSAYIRNDTAANTQRISVIGGVNGTSTATTGAYVRLTVTFTATQPSHIIQLATVGAVTAGNVRLDALQHEPGAVATAFTTTGPLIRNIWTRGYVEQWPTEWDPDSAGFEGVSSTPCVGPFAILQNADLHTEIRGAIMAKAPRYYWTLQEPAGSTVFAETSGNNGPPLLRVDSPVGPGTFAAATQMNVVGDVGGQGVHTAPTPGQETFLNVPFSCLQCGYTGPQLVGPSSAPGASVTNWSSSMAFMMLRPAAAINGSRFVRFTDFSNNAPVQLAGTVGSQLFAGLVGAVVADVWADNRPHLYVVVTTLTAPSATTTLYVDGAQVATLTSGAGFPVGFTFPSLAVNIGGAVTYTFNQAWQDQTISHVAYWNRALSGAEASDLGAAALGYTGESESQRIGRFLTLGGYTGPTSLGFGATVMGPSTVTEGASVLASGQQASDSAFGNFYESADGVAYSSRFVRYLTTTSAYTFGENIAGGEYPYQGDIRYVADPQLVLNIADVTRSGGIIAHAEDTTGVSQKKFGKKNFTRTIDIASDSETQDAATWVVANRKTPLQRLSQLTFSPATVTNLPFGDGTLWPMLLTLEIGTRVTVRRRPKAANAGAGITMSGDFFVEKIDHNGIDFETGDWLVTLQLSPVNVAQPWILQDSVYGQLDVTTVLGF